MTARMALLRLEASRNSMAQPGDGGRTPAAFVRVEARPDLRLSNRRTPIRAPVERSGSSEISEALVQEWIGSDLIANRGSRPMSGVNLHILTEGYEDIEDGLHENR
jgi:hypothetical protein